MNNSKNIIFAGLLVFCVIAGGFYSKKKYRDKIHGMFHKQKPQTTVLTSPVGEFDTALEKLEIHSKITGAMIKQNMPELQKLTVDYIRKYPNDPVGFQFLAIYYNLGKHKDKADLAYTKALSLANDNVKANPKDYSALLTRARIKEDMKDYSGAVADMKVVVANAPKFKYVEQEIPRLEKKGKAQ